MRRGAGDVGSLEPDRLRPPARKLGGLGARKLDRLGALKLAWLGPLTVGRLGGEELDRLGALKLGRLGALKLDRLGALKLDRLGALKLDRLGALKLDRLGARKLDRLGALKLDRLGALKLDRLGALRLGAEWLDRLNEGPPPEERDVPKEDLDPPPCPDEWPRDPPRDGSALPGAATKATRSVNTAIPAIVHRVGAVPKAGMV